MSCRKLCGVFLTPLLATALAYGQALETDTGVMVGRDAESQLSSGGHTTCELEIYPQSVKNGEIIDATVWWDYAPPGYRRVMFVFDWEGQWEDSGAKDVFVREIDFGLVSYGHTIPVIVPGPAYAWETATASVTVTGVIKCSATAEIAILPP